MPAPISPRSYGPPDGPVYSLLIPPDVRIEVLPMESPMRSSSCADANDMASYGYATVNLSAPAAKLRVVEAPTVCPLGESIGKAIKGISRVLLEYSHFHTRTA